MEAYMHIVTENQGSGCIWRVYEKDEKNNRDVQVKEFTDDLSLGPILDYENEMETRKEWFKNLLAVRGTEWHIALERATNNLFIPIEGISEEAKIVIWHSNSARDYLALRYLVSTYRDHPLYEADLSGIVVQEGGTGNVYAQTILECTDDQVKAVLHNLEVMTKERKEQLISEWEMLMQEEGVLRIRQADRIVVVKEDYYDDVLWDRVDEVKYRKVRFVLNQALAKLRMEKGESVSKLWLEYRLKLWQAEGKIIADNEVEELHELLIKKVTTAIE